MIIEYLIFYDNWNNYAIVDKDFNYNLINDDSNKNLDKGKVDNTINDVTAFETVVEDSWIIGDNLAIVTSICKVKLVSSFKNSVGTMSLNSWMKLMKSSRLQMFD